MGLQEGARQTTPPGGRESSLTAGEWRIARAVARGLTNRQVADRLGISHRTVETILHRVYRKLGVNDRECLNAELEGKSRWEPPTSLLTVRDWEVAVLIAQGLQDKEIAARLGIAIRSAQGSAARLRRKLGFNSRFQILRWVDAQISAGRQRNR